MSTNDLQALFANLRPKSREPSSSGTPAASSAFGLAPSQSPSLPFGAANPPTDSTNMTSNTTANAASAQNLLNLLNFGSQAPPTNGTTALPPTADSSSKADPPTVFASDLVARLMSPSNAPAPSESAYTLKADEGGGGTASQSGAPEPAEDALLKLLSKPQPTRASPAPSVEPQQPEAGQRKSTSQGRKPSSNGVAKKEETPTPETKPLFTYQNPFEQLNASRQQTPKAGTPAPSAVTPDPNASTSPIFKGYSDIPQPSIEVGEKASFSPKLPTQSAGAISTRKKLTPRSVSARSDRLVREGSAKASPTPEPAIKEEETETKVQDLPVRTVTDVPGDLQPAAPDVPVEEAVKEEPAKESPQPAADEWEDAEESPTSEETEPRKVPVYNFPIRPFVAITLNLDKPSEVQIREDSVMDISRIKKEFDQLDRSLACATTKYIAYALVKDGGMRIIRQDDGVDRSVFKHSHDRIFHVTFCTTAINSPSTDHQAVLGTGVSGTVYYATISKDANDLFEKKELETESLSFPPWPPVDENTAGGALKTRAKSSSRHPEYFAIGRGKSIHLIWPANSMCSRYGVTETNRQVDMEKLYGDRNLQISTGKAGKDFAFSEDDTLIVSLDKTGRLRFWDIRELTDETNATASRVNPVKVDMPLLSLSTASPAEKSWPTSVLFVDKTRPYSKGGALRYVLVGLRQNHTLQLWDIALGKAVQELNFPHDNETDGVCSVNYHPASGIIVVGHPTRNSIFFIHLSAPRYQLSSSVTQAEYIERIAAKDPEVPKPESTACMSGVREMSFASRGQLRSVELLPIHKAPDSPKGRDEKTGLFELYVVHSKGVICLSITKEDLGWDANNKVIHGIDAAKEGVVDMKELKLGSIIEETRSKSPPPVEEPTPSTSAGKKKKSKKHLQPTVETTVDEALVEQAPATKEEPPAEAPTVAVADVPLEASVAKESKKSKKKAAQATDLQSSAKPASRTSSPVKTDLPSTSQTDLPADLQVSEPTPYTSSFERPTMEEESKSDKVSVGISGDWLDAEIKKITQNVGKEFRKELNDLYKNIQSDRLIQDSSASARQEAVLRLVSSTLNKNVETSMANIVNVQIQQYVLPTITQVTVNAVQASLGDAVAKTLHHLVPRELNNQLPAAINAALSNPQLSRAISETMALKLAKSTENLVVDMTNKHILPNIKSLVASVADEAVAKVEARMNKGIQAMELERRRDAARIEKFSTIIQDMSETLQNLSLTQNAVQNQLNQDRQLVLAAGSNNSPGPAVVSPAPGPIARPKPVKPKTKEELDEEEISGMMQEGKYEEASVKWLQVPPAQQVPLFDTLFVRYTPEYLATDISALAAFSVAITVGLSLQTNTAQRLEWILEAFKAVDLQDPELAELADHAPQLLSSLIQKLESLYMTVAEGTGSDTSLLRQIPPVVKKAREMKGAMGSVVKK